jgi:hypothetical protein
MADHVIHISEGEAASDFAGLLARVCAGAEVVIESGGWPTQAGLGLSGDVHTSQTYSGEQTRLYSCHGDERVFTTAG